MRHYNITISPQGVAAIDWYFCKKKTSLRRLPEEVSRQLKATDA